MEVIKYEIPFKYSDTIDIYPIGDIHLGSAHCAEHDIQRKVEEIRNNKNAYVIGMGDYADCITIADKRFDMGGLADWITKGDIIESQRKKVVNLFKPIKNKIICLLTGNHEENIHLYHQDDIARHICDDLKVAYGGYSCFIELHFNRINSTERHMYRVHAWHGTGAAQTEGARLMRLMRLVNEIEADIYLMGHLHGMTQHTPDRLVCRAGRVKSVKLAATITGSWHKTYTQPKTGELLNPSYAEKKGYKPARIGCPIIHIRPCAGQLVPPKEEVTIES